MAKQQNNKEDKGKIRVFLFELEGTNETLLESIRSITGALTQTFGGSPKAVRYIAAPNDKSDDQPQEVIDVQPDDDSPEEDNNAFDTKVDKPKRARRVKTPEVLTDLDLISGEMPLKIFFDGRKVDDDTGRYLLIATWLKEHRQVIEISDRHIYTCYRLLGFSTPKDIGSIFRNCKRSGYFVSGATSGTYKLTHIGENRVQEMKQGT